MNITELLSTFFQWLVTGRRPMQGRSTHVWYVMHLVSALFVHKHVILCTNVCENVFIVVYVYVFQVKRWCCWTILVTAVCLWFDFSIYFVVYCLSYLSQLIFFLVNDRYFNKLFTQYLQFAFSLIFCNQWTIYNLKWSFLHSTRNKSQTYFCQIQQKLVQLTGNNHVTTF